MASTSDFLVTSVRTGSASRPPLPISSASASISRDGARREHHIRPLASKGKGGSSTYATSRAGNDRDFPFQFHKNLLRSSKAFAAFAGAVCSTSATHVSPFGDGRSSRPTAIGSSTSQLSNSGNSARAARDRLAPFGGSVAAAAAAQPGVEQVADWRRRTC